MNLKKIKDDKLGVVAHLISLLAEEYQAWYQYHIVTPWLVGDNRPDVEEFFKKAADDELNDHAEKLIKRLREISVDSVLPTPESWAEYAKSKFLTAPLETAPQIEINRQAESEAIEHYREVIKHCNDIKDYVTADILKHILADEEEHLLALQKFQEDSQV